MDTAGRVEKFNRRYGRRPAPPEEDPMKVRASLASLKKKDGSIVVRRHGKIFVINKKNPRWKAQAGLSRPGHGRSRGRHPLSVLSYSVALHRGSTQRARRRRNQR